MKDINFFDDMSNIKNLDSNLLKIDKKWYKDIKIYHTRYITIKKFNDFENIHSANPLYVVINSATGCFKEKKNDDKYLILDWTVKYEKVQSGITSEIKTFNGGKEPFH